MAGRPDYQTPQENNFMNINKRAKIMVGAVALAGAVGASGAVGSAFTGTGVTNTAGASQ